MQRRWLLKPSFRCQIGRLSLGLSNNGTVRTSFRASINSWKLSRPGHRSFQTWSLDEGGRQSLLSDTIYALSTASGRAAIAVIRISGPACCSIYEALCPNRPPLKPRIATVRRLHHPRDPSQTLDTAALLLFFPSPNTVTGEDVLELHVHGGPAIVRSVLDAVPQCAFQENHMTIRHADAGEFTKRAFYNNRIDLTQAEALGESLTAETEQQRRLAQSGSSGALANRYEEWRNILLNARGELEALIDFSEDQHFDESPTEFILGVTKQVVELRTKIRLHIHNASKGELLRRGIGVALLGAPNAGKSSLLNRIVGREAAIVSAEEGTTRDIVDVSVDIGGWLVNLGDTAGLRSKTFNSQANIDLKNVGSVEQEGIRRARERALQSDLVIALIPLQISSTGLIELGVNHELVSAIEECKTAGKNLIIAINKVDLLRDQTQQQRQSLSFFLGRLMETIPDISPNDIFCLSCKDAEICNLNEPDPGGIQTLLSGLAKKFGCMTSALTGENFPDTVIATEAQSYWTASLSVTHRQSAYLKDCLGHLNDFLASANADAALPMTSEFLPKHAYHIDDHIDLVAENSDIRDHNPNSELSGSEIDIVAAAEHLRHAANCLARITGRAGAGDVEDVLGVVFEK